MKRIIACLLMFTALTTVMAQQTVRGKVVDAQGEPMIGVSISVDGKTVAVTDMDGQFVLTGTSPASKLELSFLGYKTQTLTLGQRSQLSITMEEDSKAIEEVVVVGYGTLRKNDLTGSVATIGNEKLNAKGAPTILEGLQGAVAGVNITKATGRAASTMNIEIRGKNSINSSQNPIYVVDGVICSDIEFLNPQDIERIDILKDASSTAIYGSRATAGVVMVTTKSGAEVGKRSQKPTISYDGYYGVDKVARMPDFMDAREFYQYRFLKFEGLAPGGTLTGQPVLSISQGDLGQCLLQVEKTNYSSPYVLKDLLAQGKVFDWKDFVLQDGRQQNHYLAVSGGDEKTGYHFGMGYMNEMGIFKNDEMSKFTIKGSMDTQINKIFSAGLSVNMAYTDHEYASDEAVSRAFNVNMFMQPWDENGNLYISPGSSQVYGTDNNQFSTYTYNPLIYMEDQFKNRKSWQAISNVYLQVKPLKDLTLKSTFSPTFSYSREGYFMGTKINASASAENEAHRNTSHSFGYTWDNMVTYDKLIDDIHHLNVMGLVSSAYSNGESQNTYYKKVLDGTYWWALGTTDQGYDYQRSGTGYSETSLLSYALRANYSFMGRYMLTGAIRRDGSSKFAPGNRWGSFPSAAAAWRVSEEEFMQDLDWLSNLKLRVSYGVTGNNNVGAYATQLTVGGQVYYPFGTTYYQGMLPSGIVDKGLKWEKAHEVNLGLDFGFFGDRVHGSVDLYNKKSTDLLYSVNLPLETGGKTLTTNVGSVSNKGIEVALTTENIVTRDWHWSTSFTFAHNHNEVLEINGIGDRVPNGENATGWLIVGQPYNNLFYYEWDGIVSDKDMEVPDTEIARLSGFTPGETVKQYDYYNKCYGWIEGNPITVDRNGDGRFTDEDKRIYSCDPAWTGSITSNLQWKNFDFSFSIYAKQHYYVFSNFYSNYLRLDDRGANKINADWYIPAGTLLDCDGIDANGTYINPKYQRRTHYGTYPFVNNAADNGGTGRNNKWVGGTCAITDASFVKVKHITLGYVMPQQMIQTLGCSYMRLYATVTNPLVFTSYMGYDPEWAAAASANDAPSTVTWQLGVNLKF
ncbi:MAG: TonB-dependent receptor [Bacteroidales bacterium]|nr:TonB-dependent receptor [Bacteroidales bacterium]